MKKDYWLFVFVGFVCAFCCWRGYKHYEARQLNLSKAVVKNIEENDNIKLPIIMYHNITKKASLVNDYCILEKQFEEDLKYIKAKGYTTITMTELINFVYNKGDIPKKPIIITFDDGYESFYEYVFPLLKKYDMKAVMSIVGSYTDLFTEEPDHNLDYSHLNWEQVKELSDSGIVEIQNHTYNFHSLTGKRRGCGRAKGESMEKYKKLFMEDILKLQNQILNFTGKEANTFTYPYGHISEGSLDFVKEMGFKAVLTCTEKVNEVERTEEFIYNLCRFNRKCGLKSKSFFRKILE